MGTASFVRLLRDAAIGAAIVAAAPLYGQSKVFLEARSPIRNGEGSVLKWHFDDAAEVLLVGAKRKLGAKGSMEVYPSQTTTYVFSVQGPSGVMLDSVTVVVNAEMAPATVPLAADEGSARGPLTTDDTTAPAVSSTPDALMPAPSRSVAALGNLRLSAAGVTSSRSTIGNIRVSITSPDGTPLPESVPGTVALECRTGTESRSYDGEFVRDPAAASVEMLIAIENGSLVASWREAAEMALNNTLSTFSPSTVLSVLAWDHREQMLVEQVQASEINGFPIQLDAAAASGGLSSLFRTSWRAVNRLARSKAQEKALVLIASGAEDASLVYQLRDVVDIAVESGVKIYAVSLDNLADTYPLRALTTMTGGTLIRLDSPNAFDLREALQQVSALAGRVNTYTFQPNGMFYAVNCTGELTVRSTATAAEVSLTDSLTMPIPDPVYNPSRMVLATFRPGEVELSEDYRDQVMSLARVLRDNPTQKIELVGHAGKESSFGGADQLAIARARAVRDALMQQGIAEERLRVRSEGSTQPIFFFEDDNQSARYNRRVELRWLDPSINPFELVVDYAWTEEDAISKVQLWRERGRKAYFEQFAIDNTSAFRIKLWGWPTENAAETEAKTLRKQYKAKVSVQ